MMVIKLMGGAFLAAALATGAMAADAPPSPEKLALAKQLVQASGGSDQLKAVLQTMFRSMSANIDANLPAEQKRLRDALLDKMQARIFAVAPQLMDATVQVYASDLTEKELSDYVAWLQSDTGQSLKRKLPQITGESLQAMAPVLAQVTQGFKQDVIDEACAQAKCTAHDKEALIAMMNKAVPKQGSRVCACSPANGGAVPEGLRGHSAAVRHAPSTPFRGPPPPQAGEDAYL